MAARKSKSAKTRTTPKKKTAKGKKSAARTKAGSGSSTRPKKTARKTPRPSRSDRTKPKRAAPDFAKLDFADVEIKRPARAKPRPSHGLVPLLSRLRSELGPDHQPAWLVDAAAASLLPINDSGAQLFDINNDEMAAVALDQGMPALATLRNLADNDTERGGKKRTIEDLLFWTPTGVHMRTCQITAHTVKGHTFFLVQAQDDPAHGDVAGTANSDAHAVADQPGPQEPPPSPSSPPPRDDAAILREIARRIRAGTRSQPMIDDVPGELPSPGQPQGEPHANTGGAGEAPMGHGNATSTDKAPAPPQAQAQAQGDILLDPHQRAKLAHELRTPISAIIAASEIIKDERLGSLDNFHYRDYARDIHQSARHALQLIEEGLRVVTERASDPAPPQTDRADLNHLVRSALATVKHLAQKKNVSVAFVPGDRDAYLQMNPTGITQIVLNLLTNAVKFTESGGSVTAQVFSSIGEDIRVEVRDTGCGMSQADVARHLDAGTEKAPEPRTGGGLGIGLALSRKLAESNGATLEIESVPGCGTTARLAFPLRLLVAA